MDRREAILSMTSLLGYSVAPASIIGLSAACSKTTVEASWDPEFFQNDGAFIIERLGETILPRTDTPGSLDVGAHIFVDRFLSKVATGEDQEKCRKGLSYWKSDYQHRKGKSLSSASAADLQQELAYLFNLDQSKQDKIRELMASTPSSNEEEVKLYHMYTFLMMFKKLVMLGYYASEEIGENVLNYLPVPGGYNGCIPAEDVGMAWAL